MKHNHVNEASTWVKQFLSSEECQTKVGKLASWLTPAGLKYVYACLEYYSSNCTLKQIGDYCGGVSAECARQYIQSGYNILKKNFSDEPQYKFYQELLHHWTASGVRNYPLFCRVYASLKCEGIDSMDKLADTSFSRLSTIPGVGMKGLDYLTSIQWNFKNEHKLREANEIEITIHPVRNL